MSNVFNLAEALKKEIPDAELFVHPDILKKACSEILDSREPCKTFDTSILPELLQKYVNSKVKETNSEPILILSSVLCTISAMIGKRAYLPKTIYYDNLYANIWSLIIAPSGGGKTTAQNKGSAILYKYEARTQEKIKNIREQIKELSMLKITATGNERKELEKESAELLSDIEKIEGESMVLQSSGSMEGLLDSLRHSSGGMVNTSEFGAWIKSLSKDYNSGAKEGLTELFDVPKYSPKHRTKGGGIIPSVERPYISINAVSTMNWVKSNIRSDSDIESGFFARFLLFYPPQKRRRGSALPRFIEKDYTVENQIIDILDDFRRNFNYDNPLLYSFEPTAREIFIDAYNIIYDEISTLPEQGQDVLFPYVNRWAAYIPKISMLIQPFCEEKTGIISIQAIQAAIQIVWYALQGTVYLLQNDLGESVLAENTRKIIEFIARKGGTCKYQQIISSKIIKGDTNTKNISKEYMDILISLQDMGKISINEVNPNKKSWIICIISAG